VAFRNTLCDVGLGPEIGPKPADSDDVERTVGGPIAASVEAMADRFSGRSRYRAHAAQRGEAGLGLQTFRIVASRQKQLRSRPVADRVPGHEGGGKLVDDRDDHGVEVYDLIMQFEVAPAKRLERNPVGRPNAAIVG